MICRLLRRIAVPAALALGLMNAKAATEQVVNGSFAGGAVGWAHNGVDFTAGNAAFDDKDDWLSQTFVPLFAAGTSFAGSFFYDRTNTNNGVPPMLTWFLQASSTSNFSTPITTLVSGSLTNAQNDATISFGSVVLGTAGYVRIFFDAQNSVIGTRTFAIDDVSVVSTAPVPEPGTYAMILAGLVAIGFVIRRRRPRA